MKSVVFATTLCVVSVGLSAEPAFLNNFDWRVRADCAPEIQGLRFESVTNLSTIAGSPGSIRFCQMAGTTATVSFCESTAQSAWSGEGALSLAVRTSGLHPRAKIAWHQGGCPFERVIDLKADGEFHDYTFALAPDPKAKDESYSFTLTPCLTEEGASGEIRIARLSTRLTKSGEAWRYRIWTRRRCEELTDLSMALEKHGLMPMGFDARVTMFASEMKKIMQPSANEDPAEVVRAFEALDVKVYRALRADAEVARRVLELKTEVESLVRTCGTDTMIKSYVKDWRHAADSLRAGDYASTELMIAKLEDGRQSVWKNALEDGDRWQAGADLWSFARYGWHDAGRGMLTCSMAFDAIWVAGFHCGDNYSPNFYFRPPESKVVGRVQTTNVTWTSSTTVRRYRSKTGAEWTWQARDVLFAPGPVWRTDSPEVELGWRGCGDHAPGRIMGIFGGRLCSFATSDLAQIQWSKLSENWLLFTENRNHFEFPVVVVLEHCPESSRLSDKGIVLSRRDGFGGFSAAYLYGQDARQAGSYEGLLSAQELETVRALVERMNCPPVQCFEDFRFCKDTKEVEIRNRFVFEEFANDWKIKGAAFASLPPLAQFAKQQLGYPFRSTSQVKLSGRFTPYGEECLVEGETAIYRIPLPDIANVIRLDVTTGSQELKELIANAVAYRHIDVAAKDPNAKRVHPGGRLLAWNALPEKGREQIRQGGAYALPNLLHGARVFATLQGGSVNGAGSQARCEPYTGSSYLAYGWRRVDAGREMYGDVTNFRGFQLYPLYNWVNLVGGWDVVRQNWKELRRYFDVLPRRVDWGLMGLDCMEDGANHQIDMGPDAWIAVVAWHKFALAIGDRRDADFSLYLAAKEVVPLVAAFARREYAREHCNTWDWGKHIPETGWNGEGYVCGCPWTMAHISYNQLSGCVISEEEYNLYKTYAKPALIAFLSRVCRYYPQWCDVTALQPGQTSGLSENNPNLTSQLVFLHEMCDDTPENMLKLLKQAYGVGLPKPLWQYVTCWPLGDLTAAAAAVLSCDSPVTVAWNHPAGIRSGCYDPGNKTSTILFESKVPFSAVFRCKVRPSCVRVNGRAEEFSYDEKAHFVSVTCSPSDDRALVDIVTADWVPPPRQSFSPTPTDLPITPRAALLQHALSIGGGNAFPVEGRLSSLPYAGNRPLPPNVKSGECSTRGVTFEIGAKALAKGSAVKVGRRPRAIYMLYAGESGPYAVRIENPYELTGSASDTSQLPRRFIEDVIADSELLAVTIEE